MSRPPILMIKAAGLVAALYCGDGVREEVLGPWIGAPAKRASSQHETVSYAKRS